MTLENVQRLGIPEATSRRSQLRARKAAATIMTPHGNLTRPLTLPLEAPYGETAITVCNPCAMLYEVCRRSDAFANVFNVSHAARPSSPDEPWGIIIYNDEI